MTEERLAEIRASDTGLTGALFSAERDRRDLLAHVDAVGMERDELKALLTRLGQDRFVAASIRAALGAGMNQEPRTDHAH